MQSLLSHGFHRSRSSSDVAWMACANENNTNIVVVHKITAATVRHCLTSATNISGRQGTIENPEGRNQRADMVTDHPHASASDDCKRAAHNVTITGLIRPF